MKLPLLARLPFWLACMFATTDLGLAQLIIPTAQARKVSAFARLGNDSPDMDMEAAVDFSPFQETVTAFDSNILGTTSDVTAMQDSTITGDRITASGSFVARQIGQTAVAQGTSDLEVSFVVTDNVRFELTGSLNTQDEGIVRFRLQTVGTPFFHSLTANMVNTGYELAYTGYLTPGNYTLEVCADEVFSTSGFFHEATASFDVDLMFFAVTATDCPPTVNSSGKQSKLLYLRDLELDASLPTPSIHASDVPPNQPGIFFYGALQPAVPFGDGTLCVASPLIRFPGVSNSNSGGVAVGAIDINVLPFSGGSGALMPGSTWSFQYWFRDNPAMGTGWNTSSTMTVTFTP